MVASVRSALLVAFAVAAVAGAVALSRGEGGAGVAAQPTPPKPTTAASPGEDATEAPCSSGGEGATRLSSRHDVVFGPLVLIGGRGWASWKPDAFDGHGYKIPVTLPEGVQATLSVPASLRGRVGLVFSLGVQARVARRGVRGADAAVRFTACPAEGLAGRTGWAGGIVVDRRRCATLVVTPAGGRSVRRRVPLGRRC